MWKALWERMATRFGPEALAEKITEMLPDLISAVLIFAFFFLLWKLLSYGWKVTQDQIDIDRTLSSFIETILKYVILTVGVVSALSEVGINTTSLLTSLGIAGLTIGFAAKDTLSNVISGIFIFWDRPFVIDDLIEIGGQYGRVQEITLRSTRVVTPDGKMLAIPNSTIVNSMVTSFTNFPHLRLDIELTVGVDENLSRIRQIFTEFVEADERFLTEPAPQMVLAAVNDYNLAVQFRTWIKDEHQHIPIRFKLREELYELLSGEGVVMPFETLQIELSKQDVMALDQ